ncbi:MAG: YdeI/OmpD-associated family protein [Bryobacteraceae bacterium]
MAQTKSEPPSTAGDSGIRLFANSGDWLAWLDRHHTTSAGVWLRLAKKGSAIQSVTYAEALEAALCYGWIDAQKRPESDAAWLQRFTPRKSKSIWSKINREKALALIAAGRMQPAGLEQVDRAKKDGRWEAAYDSFRTAAVPEDFEAALDRNPRARAFFATLDRANRYAVLFRIQTAKRTETRARRIQQFVEMLARHEKLHP